MNNENWSFATKQIHTEGKNIAVKPLAQPIFQSSTFSFSTVAEGAACFAGEKDGYIYTRLGNPNQQLVAAKIAALEGAEAGLVFSSGMGAISSVLWTALQTGDQIIADETLYGCTFALMAHGLSKFGVHTDFIDMSDPEELRLKLSAKTRLIYFETPANPNMKILDIEKLAEIAHAYHPDILVVVDNTFSTPYLQQPLRLGADVVVHSGTKYLNGHGDVICGAAVASESFINDCAMTGLKDMTGACLSPFDAFLLNRGIKTLDLRMERHCRNAGAVAQYLAAHAKVRAVHYPGLPQHPGYEIARRQMRAGGGILSFILDGDRGYCERFIDSLKLCRIAVSLGDAETLIEHPASMTHSSYTAEELAAAGIDECLIRLSLGLEDAGDILADLDEAFLKL